VRKKILDFLKMSGDNTFLPQAVTMVKKAITADNNKEYEKAHALYQDALQRFILAIKCMSVCLFFFNDDSDNNNNNR